MAGALAAFASVAGAQLPTPLPSEPVPAVAAAVVGDTADPAAAVARPTVPAPFTAPSAHRFKSRRDSLQFVAAKRAADLASGYRVIVSLEERQLAVVDGADTLLVAPVAVGMDTTIRLGARSWTFETPRGRRTVLRKDRDPVWIPPDWHYAEVASKRGLTLRPLQAGRPVKVTDGRTLVMRSNRAGLILADGTYAELPLDEEIIFGDTLYMPPPGSENRRIPGELGRFRLDMGNGYLLHGTPYEESVGTNVTHGCIRLYDEDIAWLFERVPVGTAVYIY